MGKYSGANRNIHFLSLKRHQVEHNLIILTTDLYEITDQYRMPGFKHPHPMPRHKANPRTTNRHKRGINFDIEFNVNKDLKTVVDGVDSIFFPHNLLTRYRSRWTRLLFVPPDWSQSLPTSPLMLITLFIG